MSKDGAAGFTSQANTNTEHAGPSVIELVTRARSGDKRSWDALVERYAPLIWSICRRYRLSRADGEDVAQSVWLLLVDRLHKVRDPAALPGWLATTTRRECGRVLRAAHGPHAPACGLDAENLPAEQDAGAEQELLEAERHAALREAFAHLPPDGQRLIALLLVDPPLHYAEISARLGIPVGSIGPSRGRCLAKIRRYPAIAALIDPRERPAADNESSSLLKVLASVRPSGCSCRPCGWKRAALPRTRRGRKVQELWFGSGPGMAR